MPQVGFACASLGMPCEWSLRSNSRTELMERIKEHAVCAHKMTEISPDLAHKIEAAIHNI